MRIKNMSCPICGSVDTVVKEKHETDVHGLHYTYKTFYCNNCRSNTVSNLYDLENDPSEDEFGRIWYSCPYCGYYHNGDDCKYEEYKKLNHLGVYELVAFHECPMCEEPIEDTIRNLREEEYDDYREYYEQ